MTDAPGIYSIGALARMLGVSPTTLRSWEERYGVVVPERSAGAQRLYTRDHLEQLQFVCRRLEDGLTAADAHRALSEQLDSGATVGEPPSSEHHVLLVERDPYAAELAEYFLRTEGYAVTVARSVGEAEKVVTDPAIDLVILDLMIGGGAGLRLCTRIGERVAVLAVSVLEQHDRALAAGAQGFIRKPFEPLALVSSARDLIGTSAITRHATRVPMG